MATLAASSAVPLIRLKRRVLIRPRGDVIADCGSAFAVGGGVVPLPRGGGVVPAPAALSVTVAQAENSDVAPP